MTLPAVRTEGLVRTFTSRRGHAERRALDGLDIEISAGEVHGLLGPNGAGKTTLCKILSTVLLPSDGSAWILGKNVVSDPAAVRPLIGIVFGGERGLYTRLTARQNLRYWTAIYGTSGRAGRAKADALLSRVGLADRADERVETFSRGMKQRLHLARGLVGNPQVVILDEPTVGMDPVAAREFRDLVGQLQHEGRTLLVTTHDMAEAEAICDRVSFIDQGKLIGTEDPRVIGRWLSQHEGVRAEQVPESVAAELELLDAVVSVRRDGNSTFFELSGQDASAVVLRRLIDAGVTNIGTTQPSLEDVYLHVIGTRGMAV